MPERTRVTIAHSPDSDDAFMFHAFANGKLDTGDLEIVEVLSDIEALNQRCLRGELDVSAASVHAYAYIADRYAILSCGASMGDGYGPVVVSKQRFAAGDLEGRTIAIPGALTSATLALRLFQPDFQPRIMPFDRILDAVAEGSVDAGCLIHEGQLTFGRRNLHLVADLGAWWRERTGLPLPLGVNVVKKDLGEGRIRRIAGLLRQSIDYALDHRGEALDHAMGYARGLDRGLADRFVGMYVNDLTRDLGARGRDAIRLFLKEGFTAKILPMLIHPEFVPPEKSA
jgi:1,4-dihydroxy-6-naphthoate synthase